MWSPCSFVVVGVWVLFRTENAGYNTILAQCWLVGSLGRRRNWDDCVKLGT